MGSFSEGMRLGQSAYQQMLDNQRRDKQDARDDKKFSWEEAEQARRTAAIQEQDTARSEVSRLLTTQDQAAVAPLPSNTATAGLNATRDADTLTGYDADAYTAPLAAGTGLKTNAAQPTKAGASPLQLEKALGNLAFANRDTAGLSASLGKQRDIEYDNAYAQHLSTWKDMQGEQKQKLLKQLSYDTGVRGFGTWVEGKGKKEGYMQYLPEGADPVTLSNKEAGQLYALTNLMEVNPTRARAEMDKVSDKVAALAEHAFDRREKGIAENNKTQIGIDNRESQERSYRYMYGGSRGGAGAGAQGWQPVGQLEDGTPLYRNSDGRMGLFKQGPNGEPVALSQQDTVRALKGITAARPQMAPADTKEYRAALLELGPPPEEGTKQRVSWNTKRDNIDKIFGAESNPGAPAVAAPAREARSALPTQSGSHTAPSQQPPKDSGRAAALRDIDMRLNLQGISDEARHELLMQRQSLTSGGLGMGLKNWGQ